jgi:hypothetical protein
MDIKVQKKTEAVVILTTNKLKIEGKMFVAAEMRMSDELNMAQRKFVALEDVTVTALGSQERAMHSILVVNKDQIVCIWPGAKGA